MKDRARAVELAESVLRYLDYQHALGQPLETLDGQLEAQAKDILRTYVTPRGRQPGRGNHA